MSKLKKVQKQKAELIKKLDEVNKKEKECLGNKFIKCNRCNKRTKLSNLIYLQIMHYEEPSGCMDGDYWYDGTGAYICPKCNSFNKEKYKSSVLKDMKYNFKKMCSIYYRWGFPKTTYSYNQEMLVLGFNPVKNWKEILEK